MIEVHLYGRLKTLFADTGPVKLDCASVAETLRALMILKPGFEGVLREGYYRIKADDELLSADMLTLNLGKCKTVHIHPVAAGAIFPAAAWWVIGGVLLGGLAYAAYASLPKPGDYSNRESADRRSSHLFNGAVNAQEQGGPVPLIFGGPLRVGSTVVSAGITSERVQLRGPTRTAYHDAHDWYTSRSPRAFERPGGFKGRGGGGRKKQHTPVEGDNTLQTKATIRVVDLIGEGEMVGLVEGLKSVFIDDVPVQASDGTMNIQGIEVEWRSGLPDQAALTGVPMVETEKQVGRTLKAGKPLVRTINNASANSARVTLRFPRLSSTNNKGDTGPASVRFKIDVQARGGAYRQVLAQTIRDKNTAAAELGFRIPLEGEAPFNVRVTRLTPDSDSDKLHNNLIFARLTEIVEVRQTYPHSAVIGLTAEADKFEGQINAREYEVYGLILDVPSNYDPKTRKYTGLWDGTFKQAWSDNPAWCFYKMLTSPRFGLGAEIGAQALSSAKWELYQIGRFCDEMVPDGKGGTEPRFRFTGIVNKADDARKILNNALSAFKSSLYYSGGAVVPMQDAPGDASALVTNANVADGVFDYTNMAHSERVSAVAVSFNDPEDGYKAGIELVIDDALVEKYGYKQKDVVALFCTSRTQAQRHGRYLLFEQEHESDRLKYTAGLDQASVRPGQIITQSDNSLHANRIHGRVLRYRVLRNNRGYTLILQGHYPAPGKFRAATAHLVMPDGTVTVITGQMTGSRLGARILLRFANALPTPPLPNAICVVTTDMAAPRQWRIVRAAERDTLEFAFEAVAYAGNKYAEVEQGVTISDTRLVSQPGGTLNAPESVHLNEYLYQDHGVVRAGLLISATGSLDARAGEVQYQIKRPGEDDFDDIGTRPGGVMEVPNIRPGAYQARARFIGAGHLASAFTESPVFTARGKTAPPSTPGNLRTVMKRGVGLVIIWDAIPDLDRDEYSVHVGTGRFDQARQIYRGRATEFIWTAAVAGQQTIYVRAHDTSDAINGGSIPATATVTIAASDLEPLAGAQGPAGPKGAAGARGPAGTRGIPGPAGADGTPRYIWIAYANNDKGTSGFTTGNPGNRTHIGVAPNKTTASESRNPADYRWSKIEGPPGKPGPRGATGAKGAAGARGPAGTRGIPGPAGADGTPRYIWIAYANNDKGTSGFTTGNPGNRTHIGVAPNKITVSESRNPADYRWSKIEGPPGKPGPKGADGTPRYIWIAYANNDKGTSGFTTGQPGARTYIGVATNKTTASESRNPADYRWSKIEGPQGKPGPKGADGKAGLTPWVVTASRSTVTFTESGPPDRLLQGATQYVSIIARQGRRVERMRLKATAAMTDNSIRVRAHDGATNAFTITGISGKTPPITARVTHKESRLSVDIGFRYYVFRFPALPQPKPDPEPDPKWQPPRQPLDWLQPDGPDHPPRPGEIET